MRDSVLPKASPQRLLKINLALGAFVFLANGSALIMGLTGKSQEVMGSWIEIVTILICASAMIVSSIRAIPRPESYRPVLAFQSILLIAATTLLLAWGVGLAARSVPDASTPTIRDTWTVGWVTALAAYTTYLATRTFVDFSKPTGILVRNLHWVVGALVFVIDVSVFLRLGSPLLHHV